MRFAILAAAAALGTSVPGNAATWVFQVTTTFQIQGNVHDFLCMDIPVSDCFKDTPIDERVTDAFLVSVPSFTGSSTLGYVPLFSYLGYGLDPRLSMIQTAMHIGNDNVILDQVTIMGGSMGCRFGRPPCRDVAFIGIGSNSSIMFVSSSDGAGPVPEPATWAMMIGGLGAVGASMRHRRRCAFSARAA